MKANEFVKKYGWEAAKQKIDFLENRSINKSESKIAMLKDLKTLVESHGLVASRGGLDAANYELIMLQKHINNTFGWVTVITAEKIDRLKQAIADVESCQ